MEKPTLQGEMVVLRPVRAGDAPGLWDAVSDAEGRRLAGDTRRWTRAEVDRWAASAASLPGRYDLAVTAQGSEEYLGGIALGAVDEVAASAELHLLMRPAFRGRGYGTEAIELVLGLAFDGLGLHRVGLRVPSVNPRVQAMYDSLGFRVEGRLRDAGRDGERWCDVVVMGLLEDEYLARQPDRLG
ncbi:GNAT family N-acetyltransferase [Cellulomonas endophytica]|uniref:GNAT family N-acetyltransferase n=1 Tax=Cellulomonas endophytica TaxID=2494735 RepID=UPI001011D2C1|nr:GNAT family protein [Cellulomonas endophytica]